jgi:hypothetical protein
MMLRHTAGDRSVKEWETRPGNDQGAFRSVVTAMFEDQVALVDDAANADDYWTDEELSELALAADPDAPLDPAAVPLASDATSSGSLLPSWYMPAVVLGTTHRYWRVVVVILVTALLAIEAAGLCSSYGQLVAP